jgi:hypothetical protein
MGLLIKLQDGDTALKSLKFGNDRPGGGSSNQPYIKNSIDRPDLPALNSDFLLRGGISTPLNALEDVARLTKYFFDFKNPSGLLFTAKQNLLSRVAVKAEVADKTIPKNIVGPAYGNGTINEGIYTPLSTIAEAGIVAFGGHLNKQGIDPTGLLPTFAIKKYGPTAFVLNEPQNNKWFESPAPKQDFVRYVPQVTSRFDAEESTADLNFSNRLLRLWYTKELPTTNSPNILSYSGGPGSTLGFGTTNIKFATLGDGLTPSRTGINNIQFQTNKNTFLTGLTQQDIQVNKFYLNNVNGVPTYQETLDITKFLGASKLQSIPEDKIWYNGVTSESDQVIVFNNIINLDKALSSNKNDPDYLTKKDLSLGLIERSSGSAVYSSPINQKLVEFGRQLIPDSQYQIDSGYFEATDPDPQNPVVLGRYSSENTLATDDRLIGTGDEDKISILNGGATGYLANLNKNAGTYLDAQGNTIVQNNNPPRDGGGRGISVDFRKVNRDVRGFYDDPNSYDYISKPSEYNKDTVLDTKVYYQATQPGQKRTSRPINNGKDIIPFRIGIVDPRNPSSNPTNLKFKAYIDSFSDSYSNEWKSQTYMGRAEKQYKYSSFDRSISLGFTVVADSQKNLDEMYSMLNTLAASIAPTYTSNGYMTGNLHKLTLGNYLYDQWGIMNGGFTYEITEETPWGIDPGRQLPYYIKVSGVKFTVIHNFRPESQFNKKHQYIKQSDSTN